MCLIPKTLSEVHEFSLPNGNSRRWRWCVSLSLCRSSCGDAGGFGEQRHGGPAKSEAWCLCPEQDETMGTWDIWTSVGFTRSCHVANCSIVKPAPSSAGNKNKN
ncbi:unnamed protein product [Effrenium voratum]|uniref:Uncharacterized protein n=1 Tax=Effrenium voratum TaxID=2562239 RepID=A0AA36IUB3_9DINO|nr:unnamed protein product [Effrenium voratum]